MSDEIGGDRSSPTLLCCQAAWRGVLEVPEAPEAPLRTELSEQGKGDRRCGSCGGWSSRGGMHVAPPMHPIRCRSRWIRQRATSKSPPPPLQLDQGKGPVREKNGRLQHNCISCWTPWTEGLRRKGKKYKDEILFYNQRDIEGCGER